MVRLLPIFILLLSCAGKFAKRTGESFLIYYGEGKPIVVKLSANESNQLIGLIERVKGKELTEEMLNINCGPNDVVCGIVFLMGTLIGGTLDLAENVFPKECVFSVHTYKLCKRKFLGWYIITPWQDYDISKKDAKLLIIKVKALLKKKGML